MLAFTLGRKEAAAAVHVRVGLAITSDDFWDTLAAFVQ